MAKKKDERKFGSEKLAAASGAVQGFQQRAQSRLFVAKSDFIKRPIKFHVPKGKAGLALFGISSALGLASTVQTFRESRSFGEGVGKFLGTNVIARFAGRTAGRASGTVALKGAKELRKKSSKFAAKRKRTRIGHPIKDVNKKKVRFIRVRGRVIPIRGKS